MTRIPLFLVAAALLLAACERPADDADPVDQVHIEYISFGEDIPEEGLALSVDQLDREPSTYQGQDVRVEGTIVEVCQAAGCWLALDNPEGNPVRVHVPRDEAGDYLWTLPMDLGPRNAIVEGTAHTDTLDVDELRHYAEDAGRPEAEIEAIGQPELTTYVVARGMLVEQPESPFPPDAGPEPDQEARPDVPTADDPQTQDSGPAADSEPSATPDGA